ncbi:sulfatase [Naasia sp. SYSU D00948]|uniref:sulfatase n=1 Tax=Naasia sp. SYSU D00948 TaxID=2817379 RepID=UPI001B30ED2F|nr:sulfatase [Naasia sp. SYSU D00948]
MKAIVVLFDSLNRRFLPSYGGGVELPAFERLAERSVTFDNCYGGSMPCMPARRELHTGRSNFLHRSWGPLEPFDDSVPELLRASGVYTHLVTDHQHYWEDGGATYHNRFSTYEFFRGQEGDPWKGHVADPEIPETVSWRRNAAWRQDWINRAYMSAVEDHSQTRTVEAGLEFLATNASADSWMLQIECFDPHEPFFSYEEHKRPAAAEYGGPHFDWPDYRRVVEDDATVEHAREEYSSLLRFCDQSLGRVLDAMDEHGLWEDTLLIVCTDHGLLLGERGWWGKNVQPWYDENIHIPLFVWDPRHGVAGERREALVQTLDLGPTLLEFFGVPLTQDMEGRPLSEVIARGVPIRDTGIFGVFGGHACITDGRYVYMRSSATAANGPLYEHTLMPTHMNFRFSPGELAGAELVPPFPFTKGAPLLRVPGAGMGSPYSFGTLLYDMDVDPGQLEPLRDPGIELRMAELLVEAMRRNSAPPSQFERLGLPAEGPVTKDHLLIDRQWDQVQLGLRGVIPAEEFDSAHPGVHTPMADLVAGDATRDALIEVIPAAARMLHWFGYLTPWQLSVMNPAIGTDVLRELERRLRAGAEEPARRAADLSATR